MWSRACGLLQYIARRAKCWCMCLLLAAASPCDVEWYPFRHFYFDAVESRVHRKMFKIKINNVSDSDANAHSTYDCDSDSDGDWLMGTNILLWKIERRCVWNSISIIISNGNGSGDDGKGRHSIYVWKWIGNNCWGEKKFFVRSFYVLRENCVVVLCHV